MDNKELDKLVEGEYSTDSLINPYIEQNKKLIKWIRSLERLVMNESIKEG